MPGFYKLYSCPGEEEIANHISDVISHWSVKRKFRIDNFYSLLIDEDGAGMQISMHQCLRMDHKAISKLGNIGFQLLILI